MDRHLTLDDLVANRTMSHEIAARLRSTARRRRSFLVMAVPRLAGKSTVMRAMLDHVPADAPVRTVGVDGQDVDAVLAASRGGYIVVPEISRGAWGPGYIWGEPVRRVFRGLRDGVALATALHAPDPEGAFEMICRGNRVSDEDAGRLELIVFLRSLGAHPSAPERRVVAAVHEVAGVAGGRPRARLLFRWNEARDRFERLPS